jgi:pimeloyl-ACP methyl ester carboxylesterase
MKIIRRIGFSLFIVLGIVLLSLVILAAIHRTALKHEAKQIVPNGKIVSVNGHDMHVYSAGAPSAAPTLVFLSGSGTAAPVYDFKPLYSLLSEEYKIAVIEKSGYGYSDVSDSSRDIDNMLDENRQALILAGIAPPYILLPHSMSGLEAIYWAAKYPDEIAGLIGLDMSTPDSYKDYVMPTGLMRLAGIGRRIGLQRIPFIYPVSDINLTEKEYKQAQLLTYRNAFNINMMEEGKTLYANVDKTSKVTLPDIPILLFLSDGTELFDTWIARQEEFAKNVGAESIMLACGHYIHQHEPDAIAIACKAFIQKNVPAVLRTAD